MVTKKTSKKPKASAKSSKTSRKKTTCGRVSSEGSILKCIEKLDAVLKYLALTPNFEFIKEIRLTKLLSVESFKNETLDQAALYDLTKIGAERLHQFLNSDLEMLQKILDILSNFIPSELLEVKDDSGQLSNYFQKQVKPVERETVALWSANCRELEESINELYLRAMSNDVYDIIKTKHVGDYWDPKWHRYPPLETLTFQQLLKIAPKYLFQKRSFSVTTATFLVEALKKALDSNIVSGTSDDSMNR